MLESPSSKPPAADASGSGSAVRREFGRLGPARSHDRIALTAGAEAEPADPEQKQIGLVDLSAKAFVGPYATYYDDRWRWMDWQGRHQSWNWAAAASFGGWFAYRRMYRYAAIYGLWLILLLVLAHSGTSLRLLATLQLGVAVGLGLYGNTLYYQYFRRCAREIGPQHSEHRERVEALASAGGVDRRALYVWAGAVLAIGALLLVLTSSLGLEARWTY